MPTARGIGIAAALTGDGRRPTRSRGGETDERRFTLVAWSGTPYFTEAERAALALTEAVTRLSDRTDPSVTRSGTKPSNNYDEKALAALVLWIATVKVFNRVNVATRQVPGERLTHASE